tara:strand:+ start:166 stop:411 length:246 start_codon:yes stop_codon:yes gene_type:complete
MSLGRSIRRKNERASKKAAKKKAKAALQAAQEVIKKMPEKCSLCPTLLDRTDPSFMDTWHIAVSADAVLLTCPECAKLAER